LPALSSAATTAAASPRDPGSNSGGGDSWAPRMVSPFAQAPPAASRTTSTDTSADAFALAPSKLPAVAHTDSATTSATTAASSAPQERSAQTVIHPSGTPAGASHLPDADSSSNGAASAVAALKQRQRQQLQTRLSATRVAAADRDSSQRSFAATTGGRPGWDSSELDSHARLRASPAAKASLRPTATAAHLQRGLALHSHSCRSATSAGKAGGPGSSDAGLAGGTAANKAVAVEDRTGTAASSVLRHGRFVSRTAPDEVSIPAFGLACKQRNAWASCVSSRRLGRVT
jgi:hypothetical protein